VIKISDNYDDNDDFDDFFEEIKKFLSLNADTFDLDFLFLPESSLDPNLNPHDKNVNGFKVTYHFESGMDKPEIKIEGDFDQEKIQDYFKKINIPNNSRFKRLKKPKNKNVIDATNLVIDPLGQANTSDIKEPFTEIYNFDNYVEIIIELPGIEKGHMILSLGEDEKTLKISADNGMRRYLKQIQLPFITSMKNYNLEINNGIATIIMRKKNLKN